MSFRTKNALTAKVIDWNRAEHEIRRMRDDRVVAVRSADFADIRHIDKIIAELREKQIAAFNA